MRAVLELQDALDRARAGDIEGARRRMGAISEPRSLRERLLVLLSIHDLWLAPLPTIGRAVELQHDAGVIHLKSELEAVFLDELDEAVRPRMEEGDEPAAGAMRRLAARGLIHPIYRWVATEASREELDLYLSLEGGPDGGFDDLVAICQMGLTGRAKVELARNYWDEMGRGELELVHTNLHRAMVDALGLHVPTREDMPVEGLARTALGTLLATNRALQPEMVGALGLVELQAGPRCRQVASGLRRLGAPAGALPFYDEHAVADPRHGKAWLDEVVVPLEEAEPSWGPRMMRGAWWRSAVNSEFFDWAAQHLIIDGSVADPSALVGAG